MGYSPSPFAPSVPIEAHFQVGESTRIVLMSTSFSDLFLLRGRDFVDWVHNGVADGALEQQRVNLVKLSGT